MAQLPIRLIHRPLCPYCRRVRMYLHEKGLELELDPFEPARHQEQLGLLNPHQEVPTAVLPDGAPLYDSLVIMEYLEDRCPDPRLMPVDPAERARTRMLFDVGSMMGAALPGFVRAPLDHPERLRRAVELASKINHALPLLSAHGEFALGTAFTLADLSLPPLMLRALEAGLDPALLPGRIVAWIRAVGQRPSAKLVFPTALATGSLSTPTTQ